MQEQLQRKMPYLLLGAVAAGMAAGQWFPTEARACGWLGTVFIGFLKAVAPLVIFFSVSSAAAQKTTGIGKRLIPMLGLFVLMMVSAAGICMVLACWFPAEVHLETSETALISRTETGGWKTAEKLAAGIVGMNGLTFLAAALVVGIGIRLWRPKLSARLKSLSDKICSVVVWGAAAAPVAAFGITAQTWADVGEAALLSYGRLLLNSLAAVVLMFSVVLPAVYFVLVRSNPFPPLGRCLRDSALTAFFTRSSMANIPINLALCRDLKVKSELASVTVALGAVVNMPGATVTMVTLTACAAQSAGLSMGWETQVMIVAVCVLSTFAAAGVPSGALLLLPVTTSVLGLNADVAGQMMAIGMVIAVFQDAAGTALNSASDVWAALILQRMTSSS